MARAQQFRVVVSLGRWWAPFRHLNTDVPEDVASLSVRELHARRDQSSHRGEE
jgi:hypothetical protein